MVSPVLVAIAVLSGLGPGDSRAACPAPAASEIGVERIAPRSAVLFCDARSDAIGYEFRYRTLGGAVWEQTKTEVTTLAISGLAPSTRYEYGVRIRCKSEISSWSPTKTFLTLPCPAPGLGEISVSNITHESARMECTATADEYRWRWRPQGAASWSTSPAHSSNVRTALGIADDTTYEFACQLTCGGDVSEWSPAKTFTTLEACPAPTLEACPAPGLSEISVSNITHESARMECTATADEYRWRWRPQGAASWSISPAHSSNVRTALGIAENTTYEFACQLTCGGDISEWSPAKTFTTLGEFEPLRLVQVSFDSSTQTMELIWNSQPGQVFDLEIWRDGGPWMSLESGYPAHGSATRTSSTYHIPGGEPTELFRVLRN